MKRITAFLLCFMLVYSFSTVVYAGVLSNTEVKGEAVVSASIPDSHRITVVSEGATVFFNGTAGESFDVERLSEPTVLIRAESGKKIYQVLLNGVDITAQIKGGYYTFSPVFEDKELSIITEDAPTVPESNTYVVKGTVKRNGEPVEGVTIELRSTLKTDVTDKKGKFHFDNVECGKHSLTALENGKVVGYTEFILTEGEQAEFNLQDTGFYQISVNKNEIGIDLTLNLAESGVISIDGITEVIKPDSFIIPLTGYYGNHWLCVISVCICSLVVIIAMYIRRKKNAD